MSQHTIFTAALSLLTSLNGKKNPIKHLFLGFVFLEWAVVETVFIGEAAKPRFKTLFSFYPKSGGSVDIKLTVFVRGPCVRKPSRRLCRRGKGGFPFFGRTKTPRPFVSFARIGKGDTRRIFAPWICLFS
jgi:hypothetical protein